MIFHQLSHTSEVGLKRTQIYNTTKVVPSKIWTLCLTEQDREVINFTRSCVKNNSKLTNLMKISRIEGYNGKYGSNSQGIRKISDDLFEFDQIRR